VKLSWKFDIFLAQKIRFYGLIVIGHIIQLNFAQKLNLNFILNQEWFRELKKL
jgi:hypothetical protein